MLSFVLYEKFTSTSIASSGDTRARRCRSVAEKDLPPPPPPPPPSPLPKVVKVSRWPPLPPFPPTGKSCDREDNRARATPSPPPLPFPFGAAAPLRPPRSLLAFICTVELDGMRPWAGYPWMAAPTELDASVRPTPALFVETELAAAMPPPPLPPLPLLSSSEGSGRCGGALLGRCCEKMESASEATCLRSP